MTYPLIGNYGRHPRRRPVRAAVARGPSSWRHATAAVVDAAAPARHAAARGRGSRRSPGSTRGRSRATCATHGCLRGDRHGARRDGRRRPRSPPRAPSPAGRTRTSSGRSRRRPPSRSGDAGGAAARSSPSSTSASRRTSSAASAPRGARVRVLPAHRRRRRTSSPPRSTASSSRPGPGDPARLDGPVALARAVIADGRPLLGICLGHQIVGRAAGAETRRLRFGHHGANHPVRDVETRDGPGDGPEPRGHGRRGDAAGRRAASS